MCFIVCESIVQAKKHNKHFACLLWVYCVFLSLLCFFEFIVSLYCVFLSLLCHLLCLLCAFIVPSTLRVLGTINFLRNKKKQNP